jgi:hypothetical protein
MLNFSGSVPITVERKGQMIDSTKHCRDHITISEYYNQDLQKAGSLASFE